MQAQGGTTVPVNIVGGSSFGIYSKISDEKTYNMFISDEWLVNYSGFKKIINISKGGISRGIFHSIRGNFMLAVVSQAVYRIGEDLIPSFVGSIVTASGEITIDENLSGQICIVDGVNAYIYNDSLRLLTQQNLGIVSLVPNYVSYHNSFFLIGNANASADGAKWYVFQRATDTTIVLAPVGGEQALESKPDVALAPVRIPGAGNNIIVFGSTVANIFTQIGGNLNYQRNSSTNIDYGVVNVHTIATSDKMVCWLSQNENNAPVIMYTSGTNAQRISTDGIDNVLGDIKYPKDSTAFFYRQEGHLFYHITFYNPADNLTLTYDFNTSKFYHLSDEKMCYHPIRKIIYFNKKIYGISLNDSGLYEIDNNYTTYNYGNKEVEIPRIRICKAIRTQDAKRFRAIKFYMWLEQGQDPFYTGFPNIPEDNVLFTEDGQIILSEDNQELVSEVESALPYRPRVDISLSKNSGVSYGNVVTFPLRQQANYKNEFNAYNLGLANELTMQFRFWTKSRVVASNAFLEIM